VVWPIRCASFQPRRDVGTLENFWTKGISFCIIHEQQVVAWCTCDCTAGSQIDVGIITQPGYRRHGLAAVAVAATVEYCLSHGFSAVGLALQRAKHWLVENRREGRLSVQPRVCLLLLHVRPG